MKKKVVILPVLLILIVLFSVSIYGLTDYVRVGGTYTNYLNQYFSLSLFWTDDQTYTSWGDWNQFKGTDYSRKSQAISNPRHLPLVADLNNDGTNEIIALDKNVIKIFQGKDLTPIDSFTLPSGEFLPLYIYDIDGDNKKEMITSSLFAISGCNKIYTLGFNGSDIINETEFSHISDPVSACGGSQFVMGCKDTNDCLIIGAYCSVGTSFTFAKMFTSTEMTNTSRLATYTSSSNCDCFSSIPYMAVEDYDDDGVTEYIFTTIEARWGDVHIWYLNTENEIITVERNLEILNQESWGGASAYQCVYGNTIKHDWFTAPLVADVDGFSGTKETVVGMMGDPDEFKMYLFASDGLTYSAARIDNYPQVADADGKIVSNVILANVIPHDTNYVTQNIFKDFCVMGYEADDDVLDLLCATLDTSWLQELFGVNHRHIRYEAGLPYNVTGGNPMTTIWQNVIHSTQQSDITTEGNNLNEIASSYGIFDVSTGGLFWGELSLIFPTPVSEGALYPVDAEKNNWDDLLILTDTALWYIDNNFVNQPAYWSEIEISPALNVTWKVNTTVGGFVVIRDPDTPPDDVSARIVLYYGDSNEQDTGWFSNSSSGTPFTFSFTANKTISLGELRIFYKDSVNEEIGVWSHPFTVALEGAEFGDSKTTLTQDEPAPPVDAVAPVVPIGETDVEDNAIVNAMGFFSEAWGIGYTIIWLMIMVLVAYAIWSNTGTTQHPNISFGLILISQVIMLIMGNMLGFIGTGIIIIIVVVSLIAIGMFLRKVFTGTST